MNNYIKISRLGFVVFLLFVATLEIGGCQKDPPPPTPLPTPSPNPGNTACNCNVYDLVCTIGISTCVDAECEPQPFLNGRCASYGGPGIAEPLRSEAAKQFGVAFSAYQDAIRSGAGTADAKLWEMVSKNSPNQDIANAVTYMTNDFLYIALAQDVKTSTPKGLSGAMEITAVSDKKATLGLIEAIKAGTIIALQKGDASEIKAPISEYFSKNPEFKPANPGLCYRENDFGSPSECIGTLLEMRMELLTGQ